MGEIKYTGAKHPSNRARRLTAPVRRVVLIGLVALAGLTVQQPAAAQAGKPATRPVRLVVPFAAGGGADLVGRVLAERIGPLLGANVIVDNRPGAGGAIGCELVARAVPDGHTLLLGIAATHVVAPALYPRLAYHPVRDFSVIGRIAQGGTAIALHPSLPVRDAGGLVRIARSRPGSLLYATGGNGSGGHLVGEAIKAAAGASMEHVPYKGAAPAFVDLLAGQVPVVITDVNSTLPHARAGRVHIAAVAGAERSPAYPDVATLKQQGIEVEFNSWLALYGPAGMAADMVNRLNAVLSQSLASDEVRERFARQGLKADPASVDTMRLAQARDAAIVTALVGRLGLKLE